MGSNPRCYMHLWCRFCISTQWPQLAVGILGCKIEIDHWSGKILGANRFNSNGLVTVSKLKVTLYLHLCHYRPNAIIYATQRGICNMTPHEIHMHYMQYRLFACACSVRGKETGGGRRSNRIFPHSLGSNSSNKQTKKQTIDATTQWSDYHMTHPCSNVWSSSGI